MYWQAGRRNARIKTRCSDIRDFDGEDAARLAKDVRAGAAADFSSLLAVRPWHDAWSPRRGAGPRQPGVSGQAQLRLWLASAGWGRRSRRNIRRCAATRISGGGEN